MKDLRTIKGQEMKRSIVFATIKLIETEGIKGISAQKIADSLNISKSNIFHHFKSIEYILEEVFDTILSSMVDPMVSHSFKNAKELMMFIGQGIYDLSPQERSIHVVTFQLYSLSLHNHKYQNLLLSQKEKIIQVISDELFKLTQSNRESCRTVSEMLLMTFDGYGLSALLDKKQQHYKKLWELNTNYWCDLLLKDKGVIHD